MISASLHDPGTPLPRSLGLPSAPSFENFARVWGLVPIGRFMFNSTRVAIIAIPLTFVVASITGFAMSQLPRTAQRFWVLLSLAVLMVPAIALWSTRFLLYSRLGLIDTLWPLVAPALMATSPFYILMFYRAYRRIPRVLYEAARLDGANAWQTWWQVGVPLTRPTAVGVALLSFTVYWGDFMSPLLYLNREQNYTLPIALQLLQQMSPSDWPLLMATAVFATLLPLLLFIGLQPYFVRLTQ